jgi:hypothetical protein
MVLRCHSRSFLQSEEILMLSFLKNAARAASLGASNLNIGLSARTLLEVANQVQDKQDAAGGVAEAADGQRVHGAQKALYEDIGRAVINGMTQEQVFQVVTKAVQSHGRITAGAEIAVAHVLRSAFSPQQ